MQKGSSGAVVSYLGGDGGRTPPLTDRVELRDWEERLRIEQSNFNLFAESISAPLYSLHFIEQVG